MSPTSETPGQGDRTTVKVVGIDPTADPRWDRYVEGHPLGTVFQLSAWTRNLERTYRFRPLHLALLGAEGQLAGVMPLLTKRGLLSGRRVWSLPALPTGGPLADDDEGTAALMGRAFAIAQERDCELVVETLVSGLERLLPELGSSELPPSLVLELPEEGLDAWLRERSRNLRRSIRKARDSRLTVRDDGDCGDLRAFHRLYVGAMRTKGTFPRPLGQIRRDCEWLSPTGVFRLFVLDDAGRKVGGLLCHAFRDTLELMIIASDDALRKLRPHHALYMRAIEWALENGLRRVDFGWSAPGPNAEFKESWGTTAIPRYAYRYPGSSQAGAINAPRPGDHPALKAIWQRMPLGVVAATGSLAYRYL